MSVPPHSLRTTVVCIATSEDERQFVGETLKHAGYDVILARNPREAVSRITRRVPDLVIVTEPLAELAVATLNRYLRMDPTTRAVPLVVLPSEYLSTRAQGAVHIADTYNTEALDTTSLLNYVSLALRGSPVNEQEIEVDPIIERLDTPTLWSQHEAEVKPITKNRSQRRIARVIDRCRIRLKNTPFRLNFPAFIVIYMVIATFNIYISGTNEVGFVNIYATVIWSLYFPIAVVGLIGAWNIRKIRLSAFSGRVDNKVVFLVPTIGRMSVAPALKRVVDSILENAPANLTNYRVDVVTEEGAEVLDLLTQYYKDNMHVNVIVVPKSYSPPNGTRYKSRANQYALEKRREAQEQDSATFIYHLDDDTAVRCDTISSIAEFIANDTGKYHAAQGILAFPFELSPSLFCRLADSVRPADDFSRFHFYTGLLKRPIGGFHGEHLLLRSSIEDSIGWDFGPTVTVEDAYFALTFSERYPGCTCFLSSYSYGASPDSIGDLIKQRQRWAAGIFRLSFDRQFRLTTRLPMLYSMINWSLGIVQHAIAVIIVAYLLGTPNTSPVAVGFSFIWAFNFGFIVWMYYEGLKINLSVSSKQYQGRFARYFVRTLFLVLVFSAVEGWAALKGFFNFITRKQGFIVINKQS